MTTYAMTQMAMLHSLSPILEQNIPEHMDITKQTNIVGTIYTNNNNINLRHMADTLILNNSKSSNNDASNSIPSSPTLLMKTILQLHLPTLLRTDMNTKDNSYFIQILLYVTLLKRKEH